MRLLEGDEKDGLTTISSEWKVGPASVGHVSDPTIYQFIPLLCHKSLEQLVSSLPHLIKSDF